MATNDAILIASDSEADASLVKKILEDDFERLSISINQDLTAQEFDQHRPAVLVLAFQVLEMAERYYLGLYRHSTSIQQQRHRTIVLCTKQDVWRAYALCKSSHFDDYVLFWPGNFDAPRLPMTVRCALRDVASVSSTSPSAAQLAAQVRQLAEMDGLLDRAFSDGGVRAERASDALARVQRDLDGALTSLASRLTVQALEGDKPLLQDPSAIRQEFSDFKANDVKQAFQTLADSVQPMRHWVTHLQRDMAPHIESARKLQATAARVRSLVMVVEDDEFQRKLVRRILSHDQRYDLLFADSGGEALSALRRGRPDLILMDFGLPDIDGIEVTRRIKASESLASVPIIMVTGQTEKSVVVESLKAGAVDFVAKPFNPDILLKKIHKYVGADRNASHL